MALTREINELHLEAPFMGARMLRRQSIRVGIHDTLKLDIKLAPLNSMYETAMLGNL